MSRHEWDMQREQFYSQFCKGKENENEFVWQGPCDTNDPEVLAARLKNGGTYDCRFMAKTLQELSENFVDYVDESYVAEATPLTCERDCQTRVKEIQSAFERHNNVGKGRRDIFFLPPLAPPHQDFDQYRRQNNGDTRHTKNWRSHHIRPILSRFPRTVGTSQMAREIFGKSHKIKCMPRNSESDQDIFGRYRTLCRSCWVIRTLPYKYFPKFLNENVCDGVKCLSNDEDTFGSCRQQTMQLDVLKNLGSEGCPTWQKQKLTARTGCACAARTFSEHNMVPADNFFDVFNETESGK